MNDFLNAFFHNFQLDHNTLSKPVLMRRAQVLRLLHQPVDHSVGALKVLRYCGGAVWEPYSFLVCVACELCRLWFLAWPHQPEQDGSVSEALVKGLTACRPRLSSVSSLASSSNPSPPIHGLSSTNFKRPTVLISAGALPPSQEGRAITELANYMLELGFCFIQALALCMFWSRPGKMALADQAIPSQGLQNVMGKCCVPSDLRTAHPRTKMRIVHFPPGFSLCLSLSGVNAKLKGYIFNVCSRSVWL